MLAWWVWLAIGSVILIAELMLGTMFLLWIACGAFIAGVVAIFVGDLWWVPWVVFSVSSVALIALTRPMARRIQHAGTAPSNVDQLLGQEAVVLDAIDPLKNTGRVRVGSDEWRARCDTQVAEGERVIVDSISGTTLIVRPK